MAFHSMATSLDPADPDEMNDVYVKDLASGDITLASTSTTGSKSNGESIEAAISSDGAHAAFLSFATNLHPTDTDTSGDIYVKELGGATPGGCTLTGTEGDDILEGTRGNDVICGLGGSDKLLGGRGGDDLLLGGEGGDRLVGGSGADILRGEGGDDILDTRDGVRGNDSADGGDGLDRCRVDPGDVLVNCP